MNQIWDAKKYTADFSFVHNYGNNVAEFFDYKKISSVLDLGCVYNALNSGGQFVFEMGGIGNNALIHSALAKSFAEVGLDYVMPFYFPSIGEYSSMLEKTGFKIRYAVLFDRPTELKGENGLSDWINMFVKNPFIGVDEPLKSDIIKRAVDMLYNDLCKDGIWYADYVRLRMKVRK